MTLPVLTIFDTMTGAKRPLEPIEAGKIGMYVCGVTVYDLCHLGHARVIVTFDVVARYIRHRGYDLTYVRNFTDVDDKIIRRANERGVDPLELSAQYIDEFNRDFSALKCLPPNQEPKVSTHMGEIIAMIETLIDKGHAYAVGTDVFYAVDSFDEYGKLSGMKLDQMRAGERIAVDERKRNPADFALWKSAKPGEPTWPSPWGEGRPGWHIECSAMSCRHLGDSFDIHGGGKDLVFPHHENEIAQSEGASGKNYANNWMHIGLLNVEGEKMSKSLGNFWTIRDVLDKYHPETVRYFLLSAHYRKPINYSAANLELARHRILYLYRTREAINEVFSRVERAEHDIATLNGFRTAFHEAMDDDFNTAVGLAVLGEVAKTVNELITTKKLAKKKDVIAKIAACDAFLDELGDVFGILTDDPAQTLLNIRDRLATQLDVDTDWVAQQIAARKQARDEKDWAQADAIRDALAAKHVELMDGLDGTTWRIDPPEPVIAD